MFGGGTEVNGYAVDKFIQSANPISLVSDKPIDEMYVGTVKKCFYDKSNFYQRCLEIDLYKTAFKFLKELKSDYILIDMMTLRHDLFKTQSGYGTLMFKNEAKLMQKHGFIEEFEINEVNDIPDIVFYSAMDKYMELLLDIYNPKQIILVELEAVYYTYNSNTNRLATFNENRVTKFNQAAKKGFDYVRKKIPQAHLIPFPKNMVGDINHKWGNYPLHYIYEYYEYAYKCIDIIYQNIDREIEENVIRMFRNKCSDWCVEKFASAVFITIKHKQELERLYTKTKSYKEFYRKIIAHNNTFRQKVKMLENKLIAFYGYNEITEVLCYLLKEYENIKIIYIVENAIEGSTAEFIPRSSKEYPDTDYIIITDIYNEERIKNKLSNLKVSGQVINYDWLIQG